MVQLPFVAEGVIVFLQIVSAAMAVFVVYLIFTGDPKRLLIESDARAARNRVSKRTPLPQGFWWRAVRIAFGGILFLAIIGAVLFISQHQVLAGRLWVALTLLLAMLLGGGLYYFVLLRPSLADERIQYAMLLWATFWMLSGTLLLVLWRRGLGMEFDIRKVDGPALAQYVNTIAQFAGIVIAATMVVVTNRHTAEQQEKAAQREIYQKLELSSVELFRFECEHPEFVHLLWFPDEEWDDNLTKQLPERVRIYQLRQYICQMLNLFEMACRFRLDGIVAPEIFGSWVIWMWELCSAKEFRKQWGDDMYLNYIAPFCEIINEGVLLARTRDDGDEGREEAKRSFFKFVSEALGGCQHVVTWLDDPRRSPLPRVTSLCT
jgi:hypothetical protein